MPYLSLASLPLACLLLACGQSSSGGAAPAGSDAAAVDTGAVDVAAGSDAAGQDASALDGRAPDAPAGDSGGAREGGVLDAGSCGLRSGQRGLTSRSMSVAGLNRTYLIYLPASLDPARPIPFVFVHHGLLMSGQEMVAITQYTALADAEGIGVAFPDGQNGPNTSLPPWNVGPSTCPSTIGPTPDALGDDFAFLDAMEADVSHDQCLDAAHVFVTGFSMGGFFAHQTACMRPDIRAVAPHSGGTHDLSTCVTGHKPVIIFHGDSDPVIPDGCDDPGATPIAGFPPSATAWAARNGCGSTVTTTAVTGGKCSTYDGCPADGQVVLCVFQGMGHCWAGGAADGGAFSCPTYQAATQLEWQFFKKYAW